MRLNRTVGFVTTGLLLAVSGNAAAQSDHPPIPHWAAVVHQLALNVHDIGPVSSSTGVFPPRIEQTLQNPDPAGVVETYNLVAPTDTATNAFFQSLGTNGRACATCHEPRSGWGVSTASIQDRFNESNGTDPIFRLVDGATCPSDDVSTLAAKREAYKLFATQYIPRSYVIDRDGKIVYQTMGFGGPLGMKDMQEAIDKALAANATASAAK